MVSQCVPGQQQEHPPGLLDMNIQSGLVGETYKPSFRGGKGRNISDSLG